MCEIIARITPLGDSALLIEFAGEDWRMRHARVRTALALLEAEPFEAMIECVPAAAVCAVLFDPLRIDHSSAERAVRARLQGAETNAARADLAATCDSPVVEIPVCYGGEFGPDLETVAAERGLTPQQVIDLHSGAEYVVLMLGFMPGFPYLAGLPPELASPRRASPRIRVPAGSVAIGGAQTGIYAQESPGGWQLIGCTPLSLFWPRTEKPTRLAPGDRVRFRSVDPRAFAAWREARE